VSRSVDEMKEQMNSCKQAIAEGRELDENMNDVISKAFRKRFSLLKTITNKTSDTFLIDLLAKAEKRYLEVLNQLVTDIKIDWINTNGTVTINKFRYYNSILLHFTMNGNGRSSIGIITKQFSNVGNIPSLKIVPPLKQRMLKEYQRLYKKVYFDDINYIPDAKKN
jgi:hypothetical protein